MSVGGRVAGFVFLGILGAAAVIGLSRPDHPIATVDPQAGSADPDNVPVFRQPKEGPMMEVWDTDRRIITTSIGLLQTLYRSCPVTRKSWPIIDKVSLQPTISSFNGDSGKKYGWSDTLVIELHKVDTPIQPDALPAALLTIWTAHEPAVFRIGDGPHAGIVPENVSAKLLCGQPAAANMALVPVPGLKLSPWPN